MPVLIQENGRYIITGIKDKSATAVVIPDFITEIGPDAFASCENLRKITIGPGVEKIGENAFSDCCRLWEVVNFSSLPIIAGEENAEYGTLGRYAVIVSAEEQAQSHIATSGNFIYYGDGNRVVLLEYVGNDVNFVLPDSFDGKDYSIFAYAFYNCKNLQSLVIPKSVVSIGYAALQGCTGLESITVPFVGADNGETEHDTFGYIFGGNVPSSLRTVTITGGTIGDDAFSGCTNLTNVIIGDEVASVDRNAFFGCENLIYNKYGNVCYLGNEQNRYMVLVKPESDDILTCDIREECKMIATDAFMGCGSLTGVYISDLAAWCNLRFEVGESNNPLLYAGNLYLNGELVTDLIIPSTVKEIGRYSFWGAACLKSVEFAGKITTIGAGAFQECSGLTSVVIPDGVTEIVSSAFYGCSSLKSAVVPDSVRNIGSSAFGKCDRLESIVLPFVGSASDGSGDTHFGYIFGANNKAIPSSLKTVILTGGDSIAPYAFYTCGGIQEIVIPDSALSIGENAFYGCSSLVSVTIGSGLTSSASDAFARCENLSEVHIGQLENWPAVEFGNLFANPLHRGADLYLQGILVTEITISETVTRIKEYAFAGSNIQKVTTYANVESIGFSAFEGCSELQSLSIPFVGANRNSTEYAHLGYIFGTYTATENAEYVPVSLRSVVINSNESSIRDFAFYNCGNITSVEIAYGGTMIGERAFDNCRSLQSIIIPDSVRTIGYGAFNGCVGLQSVVISKSADNIGAYAFADCSALQSVTVPERVNYLGEGAFKGCTQLESIEIPFVGASVFGEVNTHFGYIFGAPEYIDNKSFVPVSLKTVVITGATPIGRFAFYECTGIENMTIPFVGASYDAVDNTHFGYIFGAFSYRENNRYVPSLLKELVISGGSIARNAIAQCNIEKLVIGSGVVNIAEDAFACSVQELEIKDGVTNIELGAFKSGNLQSLTIAFVGMRSDGTGATHLGSIFGANVYSENDNFVPDSLKTVTVTGGEIDEYAFYGCSDITEIILPDGITAIPDNAFYGCSSLQNMEIPDSVRTIGENAFYGCSGLVRVAIGSGVISCSGSAFGGCENLSEVNLQDLGTWCGIEFGNIEANPLCYGAILYLGDEPVTDLVIPETVTGIKEYAFAGSVVRSVSVSENVTAIGFGAFQGCGNLQSISIPFVGESKIATGNTHFGYIFGAQWSSYNSIYVPETLKTVSVTGNAIGSYAFHGCLSVTTVGLSEQLQEIGEYAFSESGIISIYIPAGRIGVCAFYNCINLQSVELGASVQSVRSEAFSGCASLSEVSIRGESQLTAIDGFAFSSTRLTHFTIPASVVSVGSDIFNACVSITVYCVAAEKPVGWADDWNMVERDVYCPVVWNCSENDVADDGYCYTVVDGLRFAVDTAKGSAKVVRQSPYVSGLVAIPEEISYNGRVYTVNEIADSAFTGNSYLQKIIVPASITQIGWGAFYQSWELSEIYFEGTAEQWDDTIYTGDAVVYFYSPSDPFEGGTITSGNYWHYSGDGITPVIW